MMFAAPRFLAVDDKEEHLAAILATFQRIGTPAMGIRFDAAQPFEKAVFRGVRALFLDLHLIGGVATTDDKQHFANIASILEDNISELGGPFILVLWTEHAAKAAALTEYLDQSLDPDKPWCRPLAILPLAKDKFINVDTGAVESADDLRGAVEQVLDSNPQLAALVGWETDVLAAAGETLMSLTALVPAAKRTTALFAGALDDVLSRLAVEAVGKKHVGDDPRTAVTAALAPILADRIVNQQASAANAQLWDKAVTRHGQNKLPRATPDEAGGINRMLHVAVAGPEKIAAGDWGAVSEVPADLWNDAALDGMLGVNAAGLLEGEFKIAPEHHHRCRPRLVRIGAVCDHAQKRPGPIPFLFGFEVPLAVPRIAGTKPPASEWKSPTLTLPGVADAFALHASSRFEITRPAAAVAGWNAVYRLREQLLMQLIAHAGSYVGRPGIVQL